MTRQPDTTSLASVREPKQQRSRETHIRILKATLECLADLGYSEVSTMRVAERAGVSKGALFQRFPSRIALIVAAVEYYHTDSREQGESLFSEVILAAPLRERASAYIHNLWLLVKAPSYSGINEVWLAARTNEELRRALAPLVEREQTQTDMSALFPEVAELPMFTFLNHLIGSCLEGMAMDENVIGTIDDHAAGLEYLIDLTVRELSRLGKLG